MDDLVNNAVGLEVFKVFYAVQAGAYLQQVFIGRIGKQTPG